MEKIFKTMLRILNELNPLAAIISGPLIGVASASVVLNYIESHGIAFLVSILCSVISGTLLLYITAIYAIWKKQ
jgi:hypothetical protein